MKIGRVWTCARTLQRAPNICLTAHFCSVFEQEKHSCLEWVDCTWSYIETIASKISSSGVTQSHTGHVTLKDTFGVSRNTVKENFEGDPADRFSQLWIYLLYQSFHEYRTFRDARCLYAMENADLTIYLPRNNLIEIHRDHEIISLGVWWSLKSANQSKINFTVWFSES